MNFEIFLNFNNGLARSAAEFYATVFRSEIRNLMTYGDTVNDAGFPIKEEEKDYIMYASVKIGDKDIMFMDMSSDYQVNMGNNITPYVTLTDYTEIDRLAAELGVGGTTITPPQKMFFSEYYAMVTDKFGITWHIYSPNN